MNWTGHVVVAPRSELAKLIKRDEPRKTGVYILLGDDPERLGGQLAYIVESDQVSSPQEPSLSIGCDRGYRWYERCTGMGQLHGRRGV